MTEQITSPFVGYAISFLLGVITILLAAVAFFVRGHFNEQKELNRHFFAALETRVPMELCKERQTSCPVAALKKQFDAHVHEPGGGRVILGTG